MIYLDALSNELWQVGIRGRLRRRILAEVEDHLSCDPKAPLGAPAEIARAFADELGTGLARRAALSAFGALAFAGALFLIAFLGARISWGSLSRLGPRSQALGDLALLLCVIAPQVAFAAGALGALRASRRRRDAVIGREQAQVLGRRATVGLLAGGGSMAGIALLAVEYAPTSGGSWRVVTLALAAAGGLGLLCATPLLAQALRVLPVSNGEPSDIFEDLPAAVHRLAGGSPWVFALAFSAAIAGVVAAVGFAASDGLDGIARGLIDALACLAGFGLLGRLLGLRGAARTQR